MSHRVDWSLGTLIFFSLFLLGGVIYFWWMREIPPAPPQEMVEEGSSFSQIQMEKAEISRVGEKGKEWALNAHSVEQKGNSIFLIDISGIFSGGEPSLSGESSKRATVLAGGRCGTARSKVDK